MNVWNKVLYCLIAVICVGFTVLAANKYSLIKEWETKITKQEKDLEELKTAVLELKTELDGDPLKPFESWNDLGLRGRLAYVRQLQQGEAFVGCQPIEVRESATGASVSFVVPDEYGFSAFRPDATVYLFDSGAEFVAAAVDEEGATAELESAPEEAAEPAKTTTIPSAFLGEFKVGGSQNRQVNLASVGLFSAAEIARLADSQGSGRSWIVCVGALPIDSPTDVAAMSAENPDALAPFDDATRAFLAKTEIAPIAAEGENSVETETTRFPVAFAESLAYQFAQRDKVNVIKTSKTIALEQMTDIFFDQIVAIGEGFDFETALAQTDAPAEVRALYDVNTDGYNDAVAAALKRKSAPSYSEMEAIAQATFDRFDADRALVYEKLEKAKARLDKLQTLLDSTIAENARLASEIARSHFLVADKIEREASTQTASLEPDFSLNNGI